MLNSLTLRESPLWFPLIKSNIFYKESIVFPFPLHLIHFHLALILINISQIYDALPHSLLLLLSFCVRNESHISTWFLHP